MPQFQNPFLGGYFGAQNAAQRSTANQIGAAGGMLSLQNQMAQQQAAQQQAQELQGLIPKLTDPAAQALARAGDFRGAIARQFPKEESFTLGPGQSRFRGGAVQAQVPDRPVMQNLPVQGQPGVTQPTWIRPGEATGTAVGGQAMPEILNQDVQKAKLGIAAAGRPSVNVKVDAKMGESFAKEIAPMMGESRSNAMGAASAVDTAGRIKGALSAGNVTLGPTATVRNKIDQVSQMVGAGGNTTEERLVNTRNVIRGLSQFALAARKQLKGQGQVSDYEGRLIQRAEAGEIDDFTLPELRDFVNTTEKLARQTYAEHQRALGVMKQNPELERFIPFYSVPDLPGDEPQNPARRSTDKPGAVRRYNPATGKIE